MQKKEIFTIEELSNYVKSQLSEKRYQHSVAVAQTTEMVLKHYNCKNYEPDWNGFSAGYFCGLVHDISREFEPEKWIDCCKKYNISCSEEELEYPVLLHGYVSAIIAKQMFPELPQSWIRAVEVHTIGCGNMDDLALALFIADYIEPNRTFMTEQRRSDYLSCSTIQLCAYAILCDIIKHLQSKGTPFCTKYIEMKEFLEGK